MQLPYPTSFPNTLEESFLKLITTSDADFVSAWEQWKTSHLLDDTPPAMAHLFPLIYVRMKSCGLESDEYYPRIKGIYKSAWVKNRRIITAASEIITICTAEKIPVILLKGIPLLISAYQDFGARFLGDADILIHPEYAPRVVALMLEKGWRQIAPVVTNIPQPASLYTTMKSTTFANPYGIEIDIHWNILEVDYHTRLIDVFLLKPLPLFSFQKKFWDDAKPMTFENTSCLRFSNEDMLIHIIVHGSFGNEHRTIRWVTDALAIITNLSIDWNILINRAQQQGFLVEISVASHYLREKLGAPIPDSFFEKLDAIYLTPRIIKEYYSMSNRTKRYMPFGNFPIIWYAYWKSEPRKNILHGLLRFPEYMRRCRGLERMSDIFVFIIKKYMNRIKTPRA